MIQYAEEGVNGFAGFATFRNLMEHTFLSSSAPEDAVICGREAIVHFMALQNKAVSYQLGNMLHGLRSQSH